MKLSLTWTHVRVGAGWLTLALLSMVFARQALMVAVAFILIGLIILLSYHLEFGWYILVALSPLVQWEWSLEWLRSSFPFSPWLYQTHAPLIEFWASVLIISVFGKAIRDHYRAEGVLWYWPASPWFALFLGSALLSLINLNAVEKIAGLKYVGHFILLAYVGYLVMGANLVKTKKIWRRSLAILAVEGCLAAVMGLVSLAIHAWQGDGFSRAVPLSLWGWQPLGGQHIFLAEILSMTLPIFLYFWYTSKQENQKFYFALGSWFLTIIGLLTLSRAGWITIILEISIFMALTKQRVSWLPLLRKFWYVAIVIFIPAALYLGYFLSHSSVARGSTSARLELTQISWHLFLQHPIIGQGVGSFIARLTDIVVFRLQFGDPLDAHGLIQKLLAEQGIVGLATFGLFLGVIVHTVISRSRGGVYTAEAEAAYGVSVLMIISPLVFQLFNTHYYSSNMWVPIALAVAQSLLYRQDTARFRSAINLKSRLFSAEI